MADSETLSLVRQAARGDRAAIDDLLTRHRGQLKRMVAVRMDPRLAARLDPSDIVQEVLAEAARSVPADLEYDPGRFYLWLRQIAWDRLSHIHRHHVRTAKRSVAREADLGAGYLPDESVMTLANCIMADGTGPSRWAIREEVRRRVRTALADLPAADREVLVLRYLEQLSTRETAALLGLSESAVKSRQLRAIQRLERMLGDLRKDDQP